LIADVKTSDDLSQIFLTPRVRSETTALAGLLRETLGPAKPTRSAQGLAVPGFVAPSLLAGVPGVALRWTEEATRFAQNRRDSTKRHAKFRLAMEEVETLSRGRLEQRLPALIGVDQLDDHQVANVVAMTDPECRGICLFDEQGAGKTVSAIFAWDALSAQDTVDFALIVSPKSMVPEWARDFARFRGDMYSLGTATGTMSEKLAALRAMPDVLITNFDTAITLEHQLIAHLRRMDGRALLIVDESFFVKNRDANRTRALRRIREWCGRAFVLCGTPAPNAARDVVEQFNLADFGVTFGSVRIPEDREEAHAVVEATLRERGAYRRSLKQDVLPTLPTKSFDIVNLELAPIQQLAYDAARADLILDLRQTSDDEFGRRLTSFMARRATLLQICSNPTRIIEGYGETPAKLLALDRLLSDWVDSRGEKVVIWSSYRASLEAIATRYSRLGLVRYDGSVPDVAARREAVRSFQEDADTMVFLGNPAAAGAGLTLHAARIAVYESLTNQAAHYLQSLDRIHRRGQEREVSYYILLGRDTIEESEYATLQAKERTARDLLGDPASQAPSRTTMLQELTDGSEP
jgi:SNF2 family DNA or RNA helicase